MIERLPWVDTAASGASQARPARVEHAPSVAVADSLRSLVRTLERADAELFATVPFTGDQASGAMVNGYVDEVVAGLRALRQDADDLARVIEIAARRPGGL